MPPERSSILVDPEWLLKNYRAPKVVILDTSWPSKPISEDERARGRIPNSIRFDIGNISDSSTHLPYMMTSIPRFETHMTALGIENDSRIICYDANNNNFFASARVWWSLRLMGHEAPVSILDGGVESWARIDGPFEPFTDGPSELIGDAESPYVCHGFRRDLLKTLPQVLHNIQSQSFQLIDSRPRERFLGLIPEPRAEIATGHVPNSINIEFTSLIDKTKNSLKSNEELMRIFEDHNVDLTLPMAVMCGSGISASVLALATYILGKDDCAVYDGSWSEYGQKNLPHNKN